MLLRWTHPRDHFVYAPSQWEVTLQCNVVSYWLGTCTVLLLCWTHPRDHFVYACSQWEATLQCSITSYWLGTCTVLLCWTHHPRDHFVLYIPPANERRCYNITSSLIDWVHTQNYPSIHGYGVLIQGMFWTHNLVNYREDMMTYGINKFDHHKFRCLAQSHYLIQLPLIFNWTLRNKLQWNLNTKQNDL